MVCDNVPDPVTNSSSDEQESQSSIVDSTIEAEPQQTAAPEDLLGEGKRHLFCGNYADAVKVLTDACVLYDAKYGAQADQCADVYYYYGEALLELGRLEPGVFGNALQGVKVDDEDVDDSEQEGGEDEQPEGTPTEATITEQPITPQANGAATNDTTAAATTMESDPVSTTTTTAAAEEATKGEEDADEQFGDASKLTEAELKDIHDKVEEAFAENAEELESQLAAKNSQTTATGESPKKAAVAATEEKADATEMEVTEGAEPAVAVGKAVATEEKKEEADAEGEEDVEDGEDDSEEEGETVVENGADGEATDEAKEETPKVDEPESNLELAWEMLDVARIIYARQETNEARLKVAQCLLKLGEVSIESENYDQATKDLTAALDIRKALLAPDDREIAEVFYQIGLALTLKYEFTEGADAFANAKAVLELHRDNLQQKLDTAEEDAKAKIAKELEQLSALIPDVAGRIEDAKESAKSMEEHKKTLAEQVVTKIGFDAATNGVDNSEHAKPVSDISHLVRKPVKRSLDADAAEDTVAVSPKKIKALLAATTDLREETPTQQESIGAQNGVNGSHHAAEDSTTTNGVNGHVAVENGVAAVGTEEQAAVMEIGQEATEAT